jgi:hypothetical protein
MGSSRFHRPPTNAGVNAALDTSLGAEHITEKACTEATRLLSLFLSLEVKTFKVWHVKLCSLLSSLDAAGQAMAGKRSSYRD